MVPLKLNLDFRFAELGWELHSLGWFREKLEELLSFQKDQEETRLKAELATLDDPADRQVAWQVTNALIDEIMPRFSRGPYLVALWALFESGMDEIAEYIGNAKHLELKLNDLQKRDKIWQWKKYFSFAAFPLYIEQEQWQRLDEIREIRNLLAHANGRLDESTPLCNKIRKWCAEDRGLSEGARSLIISGEYIHAAHVSVTTVLGELLSRVKREFSA